MPERDEFKRAVKEPVKNLVKEVLSDIVYRVTKAGTKRAINELKQELKEKSIRRLQRKLEALSERNLDNQLRESGKRIAREITQEGIQREDLIREIEQGFRQGFKNKLSTLAKVSKLPIAVVTTICIIAVGGGVYAAIDRSWERGNGPDTQDTVLPKVAVYHTPRNPEPGERVTFTVDAGDNVGIERMELWINGQLVETAKDSPLVFEGGPYEGGTVVHYEAYAYDSAGNRAWSGEQPLQIGAEVEPGDTVPPDVTVGHSPQEPGPDQRVTFTVDAKDNVGIERIDLLVNGQLVETAKDSPLVFEGGPYEEGMTVRYGAYAYDSAGNRAWSGERSFQVEISMRYPDLVIVKVWHEWTTGPITLCVIHYVIQNRGEAAAESSSASLIYRVWNEAGILMGQFIEWDDVEPVSAGGEVESNFPPLVLPTAGFTVELCADGKEVISEGNENNNCWVYEAPPMGQ